MPAIAEESPKDDDIQRRAASGSRWLNGLARVVLVAACVLCVLPWRPHLPPQAVAQLTASSPARSAVLLALAETGTAAGYRLALVALIGLVAWRGLPGDRRRWLISPLRVLVLIVIAYAALAWRYPALVGPALLAPAGIVAPWGFAFGRSLERGLGSLVRWAILSCLAVVAVAAGAVLTLTSVAPAVAEMSTATADDRHRWQEMLQGDRGRESSLVELRLTSSDLNLMAASWLAAQESQVAADVAIGDEDVQSRLTLPVNIPSLDGRFLNLSTRFRPTLVEGQPRPQLTHMQVGDWSVPSSLVQRASATVWALFAADDEIRRSLPSMQALQVDDHQLLVLCEPEQAARAATDSLDIAPEAGEELRTAIRADMQQLVKTASALPPGDERFLGLIRTAFAIAHERSTPETAALENRAVLIALGIQIGDPRVRRLAGFDPDESMPHFRYKFDREVTLRGRNDLVRHFFVSAALRSLSSKEWSFAIGLIKEQLDAANGGSGFSFADLSADLAGVQFADQATSDNNAARRLQSQLAEPFAVDDLMPAIDELPEGLSQESFKEQYGSLTDPRFLKVTVEIRNRVAGCKLLGAKPTSTPAP